MATFAFIVPPLAGHINPTLSVGAALLQRGHQVAWVSLDANLQKQLPAGGKLWHIHYSITNAEKQEHGEYLHIISKKNVYGIESVKFLYDEVLLPLNRYMYDGIVALLKLHQPDIVVTDHQVFAGAFAAAGLSIPYATSVTAPAAIKMMEDLPKVHEWEMAKIYGLQQELGLGGHPPLALSARRTLVFTSKAFFGEMALPGTFHFAGPVIQHRPFKVSFPWQKFHAAPHPKKILVSIGTTFDHAHKKAFFEKIMAAFADAPITVTVVSEPGLFESWPQNFIVQERVPQLELLPYLDAVICHGGQNTVGETLLHGLPLVVIPIAYDQSYVAGRVVQAGCGLRLNFNRFKPVHIKAALDNILNNHAFKEGAERMQRSFKEAGGTAGAAAALEEMLQAEAQAA